MVLAGGEGRRMGPLTMERAKPAIPFGGRYRIVDVVLSNFVNSGLRRIKILTQYKSASLEEHVARAWRLTPILDGFIETIPAQQRTGKSWFKGSADAVFQCLHVITDDEPRVVFIFGGDHVYKMDMRQMLAFHLARKADVSVAAVPVPRLDARAFGALEVDPTGRILAFHEKVAEPPPMPGRPDMALASMGNYIFATPMLADRLTEDAARDDSLHDFGRDILPMMVARGDGVYAYDFETNQIPGEASRSHYWRDIGTIDAYFAAQLDMVSVEPPFNLYNRRWPIRTGVTHDPPAKFVFRDEDGARTGVATDSIVSAGCIISGGSIHRSVLGNRCRVNSFSEIEECVLLENVTIGRHARIRRAIIDKDIEIPPGTEIGYDLEQDRQRFFVSKGGVVVIPKRTKLET
ncbi:MAG: glucose-1-phosphate adenylyltransferase [Deltaproteobacteria bacterium]|nr:MAG: glucose-1-phosphate adenylyltransferase [Deltaproteobacteria bacterium]